MKKKIIASLMGLGLFIVIIGTNVHITKSNDVKLQNQKALAYWLYKCSQHNDSYCDYSDHTVSSGDLLRFWMPYELY
jgi:hypothetical protein